MWRLGNNEKHNLTNCANVFNNGGFWMKRSEMVKRLVNHYLENYCGSAEIDMEMILDYIEKAGMLPPPIRTISISRILNRLGRFFNLEYPEKGMWEPEDGNNR